MDESERFTRGRATHRAQGNALSSTAKARADLERRRGARRRRPAEFCRFPAESKSAAGRGTGPGPTSSGRARLGLLNESSVDRAYHQAAASAGTGLERLQQEAFALRAGRERHVDARVARRMASAYSTRGLSSSSGRPQAPLDARPLRMPTCSLRSTIEPPGFHSTAWRLPAGVEPTCSSPATARHSLTSMPEPVPHRHAGRRGKGWSEVVHARPTRRGAWNRTCAGLRTPELAFALRAGVRKRSAAPRGDGCFECRV